MLSQACSVFYSTSDESCECYLCCVKNKNRWKITHSHTLMLKPESSSKQFAIELLTVDCTLQ